MKNSPFLRIVDLSSVPKRYRPLAEGVIFLGGGGGGYGLRVYLGPSSKPC